MKTTLRSAGGMVFDVTNGENALRVDAKPPIGKGEAMSPKELIAAGLGGCTAMDVVALLRKHKQPYEEVVVEVDVTPSEGKPPVVFRAAEITFRVKGNVDRATLLESVRLSQTKYCGVSAMLAKAFPIHYSVVLNGEPVGEGRAEFGDPA